MVQVDWQNCWEESLGQIARAFLFDGSPNKHLRTISFFFGSTPLEHYWNLSKAKFENKLDPSFTGCMMLYAIFPALGALDFLQTKNVDCLLVGSPHLGPFQTFTFPDSEKKLNTFDSGLWHIALVRWQSRWQSPRECHKKPAAKKGGHRGQEEGK